MIHVYSYDTQGFWTPQDDRVIRSEEEITEKGNFTLIPVPQPCMKPKFDGEKWIETVPKVEWPVVPPPGPTPEEELQNLKKQQELMQSALDDLIFSGGML